MRGNKRKKTGTDGMVPAKKARTVGQVKSKEHILKSKSPAEFFAEHQNIAGFDNPGKSMYTTIREFVENSLDACEAVPVLPRITVTIEELSEEKFNELRDIKTRMRKNADLYKDTHAARAQAKKAARKRKKKNGSNVNPIGNPVDDVSSEFTAGNVAREKGVTFFKITCQDNGIGMPHDEIPQMLGVVLSSTKYGVKQTRGKFGLGAKMALVWAKKSTGLPIEVWSAKKYCKKTYCKLDIDIYKNRPRVIEHDLYRNPKKWRGTEISVVIGGAWSSYRTKVITYMRQLAVITPYAHLELKFIHPIERKGFHYTFKRRSDMIPREPLEVKHHPSSVDNLLVESLIQHTTCTTLKSFLQNEFVKIPSKLARELCDELGIDFKLHPKKLIKKQIHLLTSLLHQAHFDPPDGNALSPAGEYNLRLGIIKEIGPMFVSTTSSKCNSHQGHPFVIEAGVCIGGDKISRAGLSIFRFANRIPLLFEGGNDVTSQVANKRIKWMNYKINPKQDKVGVFVSMVSTKIPFKGTSKEYIGDDNGILHLTVKSSLEECCKQLKRKITRRANLSERLEKQKSLTRHIPDVCWAINRVLQNMAGRHIGGLEEKASTSSVILGGHPNLNPSSSYIAKAQRLVEKVKDERITNQTLQQSLVVKVEQFIQNTQAIEQASKMGEKSRSAKPIWIGGLSQDDQAFYGTVKTSSFNFSLLKIMRSG